MSELAKSQPVLRIYIWSASIIKHASLSLCYIPLLLYYANSKIKDFSNLYNSLILYNEPVAVATQFHNVLGVWLAGCMLSTHFPIFTIVFMCTRSFITLTLPLLVSNPGPALDQKCVIFANCVAKTMIQW